MKLARTLFASLIFSTGTVYADTSFKGAGSFLSAPLVLKWSGEWHKAHPTLKLEYETKDSSEGVKDAFNHSSDFAVTDTPFNLEEERLAPSRAILHLPVALEAVGITYNLPGVPTGLKLTPQALSGIFLGSIKKWNDPALKESNPGVDLPDMEIRVVHREEESGLHDLFPAFLVKLDPKWTLKHEKEEKLHWPVGENVRGNEKVYEKLRLWPGVIAAVDLPYAAQKGLPLAALKNRAGNYVQPTAESLAAAASDFQSLPEDFEVNLDTSRAKQAYPLCAFSYFLVHENYFSVRHDHPKGQALVDFLNWVLTDGQKLEGGLSYAPLPENILSQVKEKVGTIKY